MPIGTTLTGVVLAAGVAAVVSGVLLRAFVDGAFTWQAAVQLVVVIGTAVLLAAAVAIVLGVV